MKIPAELIADSCAGRARQIETQLRSYSNSMTPFDLLAKIESSIDKLIEEMGLLYKKAAEEDQAERLEHITRSHPRIGK